MKRNQTNLVLGALIVFLAACGGTKDSVNLAKNPAPRGTDSVYGSWNIGERTSGAIKLKGTLIVEDGKVIVINECKDSSRTETASVEARATISSNTIQIHESQDASTKMGEFSCSVYVRASTVSYTVSGNVLRATMNGYPVEFPRSR